MGFHKREQNVEDSITNRLKPHDYSRVGFCRQWPADPHVVAQKTPEPFSLIFSPLPFFFLSTMKSMKDMNGKKDFSEFSCSSW